MGKKKTSKTKAATKGIGNTLIVTRDNAFEVKRAPASMKLFKIKTDSDYHVTVKIAKEVKAQFVVLEADREEIIVPIRGALDKLYEKHRMAKGYLETQERACKDAIEAYALRKAAMAIKAAERKAVKAPTPEIAHEIVATAVEKDHVPKIAGVSYRTVYEFSVIDEEKVPVNVGGVIVRPVSESVIGQLVKASKGQIKIPGVECRVVKKSSIRA